MAQGLLSIVESTVNITGQLAGNENAITHCKFRKLTEMQQHY